MEIYLVRHGIAEDATASNMNDFKRALTPRGIERTRAAARLLASLGVEPTRLLSSPLVRARQTADILGGTLDCEVEVHDEVGPGFGLEAVGRFVAKAGAEDSLMFVGHEPDFSAVVSGLIGGGVVRMKRGSIARVDLVSSQPLLGALVWLLAPKVYSRV